MTTERWGAERLQDMEPGTVLDYTRAKPGLDTPHGRTERCLRCGRMGAVRRRKAHPRGWKRDTASVTHRAAWKRGFLEYWELTVSCLCPTWLEDSHRPLAWITEARVAAAEEWIERHGMGTTAMDMILGDPATYATVAHWVEHETGGVGEDWERRKDNGGKALCGQAVPPHHPEDTVRLWYDGTGHGQEHPARAGIRMCKRCIRKANKIGEERAS